MRTAREMSAATGERHAVVSQPWRVGAEYGWIYRVVSMETKVRMRGAR